MNENVIHWPNVHKRARLSSTYRDSSVATSQRPNLLIIARGPAPDEKLFIEGELYLRINKQNLDGKVDSGQNLIR